MFYFTTETFFWHLRFTHAQDSETNSQFNAGCKQSCQLLSSESLTIKVDNSQTTYNNKTVTHNICSNWPQKVRTCSMTASFSHFCPHFQLRTNQRKADTYAPKTDHIDPLPGSLQISFPNFQSGQTWSFVFFLYKAFPLLWLPLNLCQTHMMVADALAKSKLIASACSHLGCLH